MHLPQTIFQHKVVDTILVIVDRFTKYMVFLPVLSTINTMGLVELFHMEIELCFGPPNNIVSDRGSIFTSKFWSNLCYKSHVKLRFSTMFYLQTNGQIKWMNQVLESYFKYFVNIKQTNWPILLVTIQFACNNKWNSTLKMIPFHILYTYNPNFHMCVEDNTTEGEMPIATTRLQKLGSFCELFQNNWWETNKTQTKYYNRCYQPKEFKKGQFVVLSIQNLNLK